MPSQLCPGTMSVALLQSGSSMVLNAGEVNKDLRPLFLVQVVSVNARSTTTK